MLTYVDVFLGGAMVMLAVSLLVTIATQIASFVFNLRGGQLHKGLTELFGQLHLGQAGAKLATRILTHPLISDGLVAKRFVPAISKVDLKALLENAGTLLEDVPVEADKLKTVVAGVDLWFDATMSKVSHRFTMQTRLITIIGSVLAAFILQLDAFGLMSRLYADSALRTRLAGAADSMVTQGERVLAKPSIFGDAASTLLTEKTGALTAPTTPIVSREQAEAWIYKAVGDPKDAAPFAARYDAILQDTFTPAIKSWLGDASAIKDQLAASGLRLVPQPYRPYSDIWLLLGVLTSAALLSLGAPFWFNALKTASNLRPAIAAAVQTRDDADRAR